MSPPQVNLQCGETASVDVRINDVTDLFGVDIKVSYDPDYVEVVDADSVMPGYQIQPGDYPDVSQSQGLVQANKVETASGTISYTAVRIRPAAPQTGSGVIASIEFRGKAAGTSPVNLVANPSFELGTPMPSDWAAEPPPDVTMQTYEPGLYGDRCVMIHFPDTGDKSWVGWRQDVPIAPGHSYLYSAWV